MKNKKAIIGSFMVLFVATICIFLILLGYIGASVYFAKTSKFEYGVENKYEETNLKDYLYCFSYSEGLISANLNSYQCKYYAFLFSNQNLGMFGMSEKILNEMKNFEGERIIYDNNGITISQNDFQIFKDKLIPDENGAVK